MRSRTPLVGVAASLALACSVTGGANVGRSDSALSCTPFEPRMTIIKDTRLCGGTHRVALAPGEAAVTVDGDDLTLTCDGDAIIENTTGFGPDAEPPSVGIRIGAHRNVRVERCGARGFRYGLVATNAVDLALDDVHLDENFSDGTREWVQDGVQGGGARLEGVQRGVVTGSTFARNWNGIELRHTKDVAVRKSKGDHCSNWGAFVDHADDSELSDNDFDWGLRWGRARPVTAIALEARDRTNWFGQDTKDSGGIIVDGGSARTRLLRNTVRNGGDGIFVRAITGRCPIDTWVEGNDVSFSPHFAMETWCEGDTYVGNTSRDSDNGFWLGGASNVVVTNNHIERSRVYAMSIMENEGRHILVQDNVFEDNRAGIMVTGRNRWPGQPLDSAGWPNMANSSHVVLQRNTFIGTALADVAASFTRSLVVASNCSDGKDTEVAVGPGAEAVQVVGHCGAALADVIAPTVSVTAPSVVALGSTVTLSASATGLQGYTWLVQPANPRFASGILTPAVLTSIDAPASVQATFATPGLFDVDVTVIDGPLAGIFATAALADPRARPGWRQVAVPPVGRRIGEHANEWTFDCGGDACTTRITNEPGLDGAAVRLATDAPHRFAAIVPADRQLGAAIAPGAKLGFFLRADHPKVWQRAFPKIVLGGSSGQVTLTNAALDPVRPAAGNILKFGEGGFVWVEVPLAGGDGFTRNGDLPKIIEWIAIHSETTEGDPFAVVLDDVTLY